MGTGLDPCAGGLISRFEPLFQSPSRWGRCCILQRAVPGDVQFCVSVPFSMGTVLHPSKSVSTTCSASVSVPFSMGTVLHLPHQSQATGPIRGFSPLLDGDGVASFNREGVH